MVLCIRLFVFVAGLLTVLFLFNPDYAKRYIEFWQHGNRIFIGAVIKLISGIIFLIGASQCRLPQVIIFLGILAIASAFLIVLLGHEKMDRLLAWYSNITPIAVRIFAIIGIGVCGFILYAA